MLIEPDEVTGFLLLDAIIAWDWEVFFDALWHHVPARHGVWACGAWPASPG
jgi:hypothetical protein